MQDYEASADKSHQSVPSIASENSDGWQVEPEQDDAEPKTPLPVSKWLATINLADIHVDIRVIEQVAVKIVEYLQASPSHSRPVNARTHIFSEIDAPVQKIGNALQVLADDSTAPIRLSRWGGQQTAITKYRAHEPEWLTVANGGEGDV